jgi:hypothetical protein
LARRRDSRVLRVAPTAMQRRERRRCPLGISADPLASCQLAVDEHGFVLDAFVVGDGRRDRARQMPGGHRRKEPIIE